MIRRYYRGKNIIRDILDNVLWYLGALYSLPFNLVFMSLKVTMIDPLRDHSDYWSWCHAFLSLVLVLGVEKVIGLVWGVVIGAGLMGLYEYIIDGYKLMDKRGCSILDMGYNLLGIVVAVLIIAF